MWWWGREVLVNVSNMGSQNNPINWKLSYHLGCRIDVAEWWCFFHSKVVCVVAGPIWYIYFLTLPPPKGNISALTLTLGSIVNREELCFAMVCKTIHIISKLNSRNIIMVSKIFQAFCADFIGLTTEWLRNFFKVIPQIWKIY